MLRIFIGRILVDVDVGWALMRLLPVLLLSGSSPHMLLCYAYYLLLLPDGLQVVLRVLVPVQRPLLLILVGILWKRQMMRGGRRSART